MNHARFTCQIHTISMYTIHGSPCERILPWNKTTLCLSNTHAFHASPPGNRDEAHHPRPPPTPLPTPCDDVHHPLVEQLSLQLLECSCDGMPYPTAALIQADRELQVRPDPVRRKSDEWLLMSDERPLMSNG